MQNGGKERRALASVRALELTVNDSRRNTNKARGRRNVASCRVIDARLIVAKLLSHLGAASIAIDGTSDRNRDEVVDFGDSSLRASKTNNCDGEVDGPK